MSKQFQFPFGHSLLKANIPANNIEAILKTKHIQGLDDERESLINSLRNPIGCPSLVDCIDTNHKVVIIVTDNTRPCPDKKLLPPILDELERKIPSDNITIIVALGLHTPMDKEKLVKKFSRKILENYNVINHYVEQVSNIGKTSRGTPIDININVLRVDFRISTGLIEPHFFAGFSGGRKSIAPGVSSTRSIHANHSYKMIEHPKAKTGILDGNPIHEDMVEQAKVAKLDFIVNVLLNDNGEITHIFAGDAQRAHETGCQICREKAGARIKNKVDIAISTNGGAPLDLDLYQTCKGIDNASKITREGGIIIIASACDEGVGPEEFEKLHATSNSPSEILQKIRNEELKGVQWQNQILAHAQMRHEIYLVSNLKENVVTNMKMTPIRTIEEGLEKALNILGNDAKIALIPEGPSLIPLLGTGMIGYHDH